MTTDGYGIKHWCNAAGKHHRTDGPALELANGTKEWWVDGKLHRTDGPAVEHADGHKEWYLNGKLHRTDGPTVERTDGSKAWYLNGKLLGEGAEGFWTLWDVLSDQQRADLNIQLWAAKYTGGN